MDWKTWQKISAQSFIMNELYEQELIEDAADQLGIDPDIAEEICDSGVDPDDLALMTDSQLAEMLDDLGLDKDLYLDCDDFDDDGFNFIDD